MTSAQADLTRNQSLVLRVLNEAGTPMSAYDILDRLRESGMRAPLQVYRALEKLIEHGNVHRLESLNAFVACSHAKCHDSGFIAFAICESCGNVSEFSDPEVTSRLAAWTQRNSFRAAKTTIEIRGECSACAGA